MGRGSLAGLPRRLWAGVEERQRVEREFRPQGRFPDIEIHVKGTQGLVCMWYVTLKNALNERRQNLAEQWCVPVSVGNLLRVHPASEEKKKRSDGNKQETRRDVGVELDAIHFPVHIWKDASKDVGIRYVQERCL